ncbi:DNA repair protein RecO [Bengtsoniella intestinalis]|uniref:DNA repair protein RecO n=1 Tax=Bengtsoniella intestinalis TaxID=3073143 RepID=UPI00391F9E44
MDRQARTVVTQGIVLRETHTKETDKILTVLTPHGKLSVIAKGARRKRCPFVAMTQVLAYGEMTLTQRGQWYYLDEGNPEMLFDGLRKDLEALALGCYFAELCEAVSLEGEDADQLLRHLLNGLYALANLKKPLPVVKAAFEVRLCALSGYEPLVEGCGQCGLEHPNHPVMNVVSGMVLCKSCSQTGQGLSLPLCGDSLAALQHCVWCESKRLYAFALSGVALERFVTVSESLVVAQLERSFKSLEYYKSLQIPALSMEFVTH